jgi:hypothetical protein
LIVRDNIDRLKVSPVPDPVAALRAGLAASGDLRERERQLASAAASIDPSVIPLGELSALILDPGQPLEIQRQCLLLTCRAMLSETNAPEAERILFATMRSADISVDVRALGAQYNAILGVSDHAFMRECIRLLRGEEVPDVFIDTLCAALFVFAVERSRASVDAVVNVYLAGIDEQRASQERRAHILRGLLLVRQYLDLRGGALEPQTASDLQDFADREFARAESNDEIRYVASRLFDDSHVASPEARAVANRILESGGATPILQRAARRVLRNASTNSSNP